MFMASILAASDFNYVWIIAGIGAAIGFISGGTGCGKVEDRVKRLSRQVSDLEQKLDSLLKHQGIELPAPVSDLSPEVQRMAQDPHQKIAAIKLYREEHPGAGLAEAKKRIEEFFNTGR